MSPNRVGSACWTREGVQNSLYNVANLSASHADYFLASHTPIRGMKDDRTGDTYTEEQLFQSLFDPSRNEVMGIVHGEPGSGKSHLIRWLKLRTEVAVEDGDLSAVRSVLVRRIAGSLKEALQQIIEQLGGDFKHYLEPIRTALATISNDTALATLASHLYLELGPRRSDRGLPALTGDLRDLPEFFNAPGTREWTCRKDGTLDRTVKRLTQTSDASERQSLPSFSAQDFAVPERLLSGGKNPNVVEALGYDFLERPELCEEACTLVNKALPDALRSMTGLTGGILQSVLSEVRRDLFQKQQTLAVFIEDVSVWSALGGEVVNAFEPQSRDGQCRMISVLGMVDSGYTSYTSLPVNQQQRATHIVSVGGDVLSTWRQDQDTLSKFAARYLNVTRLTHERVAELASQRRVSDDLSFSACDECEVRTHCHATWGFVEIGKTRVGLFPLTPMAPRQLLNQLRDDTLHSPRGLIMHVLHPLLANPDAVPNQFPPDHSLALNAREPSWLAGFIERYCATWSQRDVRRIRLLIQGWIDAVSASDAASHLQHFLTDLALPAFTESAKEASKTAPISETKKEGQSTGVPEPTPQKLQHILDDLSAWQRPPHELSAGSEARDLVFAFLRDSITWELDRELPPRIRKKFVDAGKGGIEFEGQRARSAIATYKISLPRAEDTVALVGALARFKYLGKDSWDFEDSEIHKRTIGRWLRRNEESIRAQLKPRDVDIQAPIRMAVNFLSLATLMSDRHRLDAGESVATLTKLLSIDDPTPVMLSDSGESFAAQVSQRKSLVRAFVLDELDAPQGTGACVFIDPLPLLETVAELQDYKIDVPADLKDISRYRSIIELSSLPPLDQILACELISLTDAIGAVATNIECDSTEDADLLADQVETFCKELSELRKLQEEVKVQVAHEAFNELWRSRVYSDSREVWANALRKACKAKADESPNALLFFDPTKLKEAVKAFAIATSYVQRVEHELNDHMADLTREGDPQDLSTKLLAHLAKIAEYDQQSAPGEQL